MAKRFTSTEIWSEDWFIEMPTEYKLFWYYLLSNCNHAGLFRVNLKAFCSLNDIIIEPEKVLLYFNVGKQRVRVINSNLWLIEDFFSYQYGTTFNPKNRVHLSIENEYIKVGVKLTSIRGLIDLKDRVKDKDIDITVLSFKEQLLKDKINYEKIAMSWRVKLHEFETMVEAFDLSVSEEHADYPKYRSHFYNWGKTRYDQFTKKMQY
jgi:hypothetical protein